MLIVNANRTEVFRASDIVHISQGDNCCIVGWSVLAQNSKQPDLFFGRYDSPESAGRALSFLIKAIVSDNELYFMPIKDDPAIAVNTAKSASVLSYRQGKTNRKNQ